MNRKEFKKLAAVRLKEAKALLKTRCFDGAYYLAGYVVEFAFKSCIAKKTARHDFPPDVETVRGIYKHKPSELVKAADMAGELEKEKAADPDFRDHWLEVVKWTEASRYQTNAESDAKRLLKAVSDSKHGVLQWIKRFW